MDFDEVTENQGGENAQQDDFFFQDTDTQTQQYTTLKDCVIFLIDCSSSMQGSIKNSAGIETNSISLILSIAESFLKTKIITNEKDLFGIVLYNTSTTNNEMNCEGVNKLIDIVSPDASLIKKLKIYSQNTNPALCPTEYLNTLNKTFPSNKSKKNFLSNALWICHSMLKGFDKAAYNRRIFLFSDNDDPLSDDITERNLIFQRAKDMLDTDIIIELFPMNFKGKFELGKFYINIIPSNDEDNNDTLITMEQCEDRLRELTKRIRQKEVKKRTLGSCPFYLGSNMKIYLNLYSSVHKSTKGKVFNIDAKSNKLLSSSNQLTCKETGGSLYPNQIGTFQLYGNKKVIFSKEEMTKIKTLDEPGIKLMGFKSIDTIKPYYNVRESYFLYPNETLSSGAMQLCDALIKQMANKNKCAIVKFVGRSGATVKMCAMLPQKEVFDEDYFQTPPGFNLIVLPYADDIRSSSDLMKNFPKEEIEITNEQRELAKKLIKKMNISFDCRNFENITLQKFYATLQALALEESEVEEVEDLINPDNEALEKVLGGCDNDFREAFNLNIFDEEEEKEKGKKRPKRERSRSKSQSQSRASKKKKKEEEDEEMKDEEEDKFSDSYLKKIIKNGKIDKYTVAQLKDICKMRKIPVKGKKKGELIDALKEDLDA